MVAVSQRARAVAVLALVLGSWAGLLWLVTPVWDASWDSPSTSLAGILAAVLVGCWTWLSLVTAAVAFELACTGAASRSGRLAPRGVRTFVTAVCGIGVLTLATPAALAEPRGGGVPVVQLLEGLALPDRVMGTHPPSAKPGAQAEADPDARKQGQPRSVTVRPGDTLWELGERLGLEWHRLYDANRSVIGPEPDLIHPGQQLVVPPTNTSEGTPR